ncbi:peptidylprolyl isomerase [Paenibacillus soyae]|uniref:Peptidylprolyl isomerase n=1 Tax=Paenibacillus soyae TaxID=2969249 RepID=A0A9X2MSX2_9BACL|nr:peptidylprolyl isomerase [Paenibacillus soyae]MCR2805634.1 peptidylprolyl isomerase [Paenibacillus soyae]
MHDTIIATYEDGTVTADEFNKYIGFLRLMNHEYKYDNQTSEYIRMHLRTYIGYKVLTARLGRVSDDEVRKKVEVHVNSFYAYLNRAIESDSTLRKQMEQEELSESDIKYYFRLMTSVRETIEYKITDEALKANFEETKADYNIVTLRHILINTTDPSTGEKLCTEEEALDRAQEVKRMLDAGGDWTALAKEYSDDPATKDDGGLYVGQTVGSFVTEFKDAANKQEVGKIGDPLKLHYSFHVIKVEKREDMTYHRLTENQKIEIRQLLASEVIEKFMSDELEERITKIDLP